MNQDLQSKLFTACPLLYKHFKGNPKMQIDCPDDLFEFIFELSSKIEDFNRRFPKRCVRAMKVAMESGELVFGVHREVFTVNKLIAATASKIRAYRRNLKQVLLERANPDQLNPVHSRFIRCIHSKTFSLSKVVLEIRIVGFQDI